MKLLNQLDTVQLQSIDSDHHLHPFTDTKHLQKVGSRIIEHANGIYIWDTDGNRIIDGMAGLWCVNVGYGRDELVDASYRQMSQLPYYNTFFQTSHPPVIELSEKLAAITPRHINHVFLTNSGSEANDTVIRMVRRFWDLKGQSGRDVIISRVNAYHGSTVGAGSLTGMAFMHEQGGLPIPGIEHIRQPYWYQEGSEFTPEEFGMITASALEEKILELGADKVAAFIAEPIQGAGGVIVPPVTYWPEISRICKQYDVLLVADEVICGFGRTGRWFGTDYYQLNPDLMVIAKGLSSGYLPIAGVLVSDRVSSVLIEEGGKFAHGFTYSGHPVSCAVASENIRILSEENIVAKVQYSTGPYFQKRLQEVAEHPLVGETRGVGLIAGIELVKNRQTKEQFESDLKVGIMCREISTQRGLIMRAIENTMVLSPPLILKKSQIDDIIRIVFESLDETQSELAKLKRIS